MKTLRLIYASPDGKSAVHYATSADGWNYTAPVEFENLSAQQKGGWQLAMSTLASLAPEGATVTQIIIEPIRNGKVTATEERETEDGMILVPIAWEDSYRVTATYSKDGRERTESWEASEPSRQFLKAMWTIFEQ